MGWQEIKRCVGYIRSIIEGLTLIYIFLPFLIIVMTPVHLYRKIIFYVSKLNPHLGKMLSIRSCLFVLDRYEKVRRGIEVFPIVVEGSITVDAVREMFQKKGLDARCPKTCELLYPEFQQCIKIWMGYPFWAPLKGFDLKDYINYYEDKSSPSVPMDFDKLFQIMKELPFKYFDEDQALWDISIVRDFIPVSNKFGSEFFQNYRTDQQYSLIIFRAHHSVSDGFSKMKFFTNFMSVTIAASSYNKNQKQLNCIQSFLLKILLVLKAPFDLALMIRVWRSQPTNLWSVDPKDRKLEVQRAISEQFPMVSLKEIKNRHNVSVTSVVLAAITSGLREVMISKLSKLPQDVRLMMSLPLPGHSNKMRNHATSGFVPLPVGEPNSLKRLQIINQRFQNMKKSALPIVIAPFFSLLMGGLPVSLLKYARLRYQKPPTVFVLTSFPGISEPTDIFGCPMKETFVSTGGMVNTNAMALGFFSFGDYARFSFASDTAVLNSFKEAQDILRGFRKELNYLKNVNTLKENV